MRRPPKPFVVEVKRGRKANGLGILGRELEAAQAVAERPEPAVFKAARIDAERAFARKAEAPEVRILPDLTPAPEPPPAPAPIKAEEKALPRPATRRSSPGRKALPADQPILLAWPEEKPAAKAKPAQMPAEVRRDLAPAASRAVDDKPARQRRNRREVVALPRGERWKRRLPSVLR